MVTLQEQFEKDFSDKGVRYIYADSKYRYSKFTNQDLDLREYVNLTNLDLKQNNLTSVDFLNTIPNPEKLKMLIIYNNNIQPTNIEVFSKFVNLKDLRIGTMKSSLEYGHNKFYGSFKSWKNLTKLKNICIEATDVDSGLEYLPESLAQETRGGGDEETIECSPNGTNAKCVAIQNELRSFNYDLEAWQLAHPDKMLTVWKEKYADKEQLVQELQTKITQTKQELEATKTQEADKVAKISRLETKLQLLEQTKTRLETELTREQQQHNQTKTNFQSQLRDLLTILFPSNTDISNLSFADLKKEVQAIKQENQVQQENLTNLNKSFNDLQTENKELLKQNTELTSQNQIQQQTITNLTQQLKQQTEEIKELKLQLETKTTELNEFKEKVKEKLVKIKATHQKLISTVQS